MSVNPFKYTRSHTHSCGMACFCCRQIDQDDTQQHRNGHENENDREEWINLHSYIRSFSTVFYCNSSVWQSNIGRHCQRAFCVGVRYHLPPCWRCRRHFCRRLPCSSWIHSPKTAFNKMPIEHTIYMNIASSIYLNRHRHRRTKP